MTIDLNSNVMDLLPNRNELPKNYEGQQKWERAVSKWFFEGMKKTAFTVKEGIDKEKAFKHLAAIISSWYLEHEHKTEGAAYLMSLWFKDVSL